MLDQYLIEEPTAFEKFFGEFVANTFHRNIYEITLTDGTCATGVPTASVNDVQNFMFHWNKKMHRIPFADLKNAKAAHLGISNNYV